MRDAAHAALPPAAHSPRGELDVMIDWRDSDENPRYTGTSPSPEGFAYAPRSTIPWHSIYSISADEGLAWALWALDPITPCGPGPLSCHTTQHCQGLIGL